MKSLCDYLGRTFFSQRILLSIDSKLQLTIDAYQHKLGHQQHESDVS